MAIELARSNVVVAAHQFNPSIFSQIWLVRHDILGEDDFRDGCVFSDMAVNVRSREFDLMVVPPQLQFVPKVSSEAEAELVATRVGTMIRALPHTPYGGVGLNFLWRVQPEDADIYALSRRLFYLPDSPVFEAFATDEARFGAYVSKNTLGCRLKLDIKPITHRSKNVVTELLQFAFNYHLDLPDEGEDVAVRAIVEHLERWDEAREEAVQIVQSTTR